MARNPLFKVQAFAPGSAWSLALLAPDAPDGTPRVAALTGQGGKLLADERAGNGYKVPYSTWLHSGHGHFVGGWRRDEELLEYGEVVRRRATENANGPNRIAVATMAYARDLAPGATPPTFAEVWERLAGRAAIVADGFAPMIYGTTDFPTIPTYFVTDQLYTSMGLSASVTLKGERMAAFSYKDEFGHEIKVSGDAFIEGAVNASNDTTQHAADVTDFPLRPPFFLFPNVSAGARLRLHFRWEAQLSASVATGKGSWRPANLTVARPAFAPYTPPKAFVNSDTLLEGNYGSADSPLTVPLALTPADKGDGTGYAHAKGKLTFDVTVPPSKLLLFAWADGLIKTLIEAIVADATPYTGDPDDGPEERKHREHLRAELGFTLALFPLLTEEILEATP